MKNLEYIIEQHGFDIVYQEDTIWIGQYTPAGEDWNLYFDKLEDIIEYAEEYDKETNQFQNRLNFGKISYGNKKY